MRLLDHFSRITATRREFLPQVDGLRFLAIMAVIAFHVWGIASSHFTADGQTVEGDPVNDLMSVGHYGVDLFFVISGFILGLPFARWHLAGGPPVQLGGYYARRVLRIEPPYVIHLVVLFLLCALVLRRLPSHPHLYHDSHWLGFTVSHLLASLFYLNSLIYQQHPYPNIVLWSLEVEVQFYLLAPLLAGLFRIPERPLRRGLLILMISVGAALTAVPGLETSYRVYNSFIGYFPDFFVGLLLADLNVAGGLNRKANWKWDLFPLGALLVVVARRHGLELPVLLPWIFFGMFHAAFRGPLTAQLLSWRPVVVIGGMCYTIYLYHWLMIYLLLRFTGHIRANVLWLDLLIQFILLSAIIVAFCAVLFLCLERPFMRRDWPNRLRATLTGWMMARRPASS